jgi:serine/threonine protein kinase
MKGLGVAACGAGFNLPVWCPAMDEGSPAHKAPSGGGGAVSGEQATVAAGTPVAHARTPGGRVSFTGREVAGRYAIMGQLGEGGMGMVYEAEHLSLKKRVAFKVIHPELARHEELMLRFKREALATGQLEHAHICSAIDFGELEDGGAFMVMPLVRGGSLQAELDRGERMALRRAALLCAQIADALSAAHSVGIVHRDLKPDNVLVERRADGSEAAKVLDFGVASLVGQGAAAQSLAARPLTQAGTILGTPGYMSPEQASAGEIDHRTDLYALGVILWELCRGQRLFDADDITAIFTKQFSQTPPPLELGSAPAARELSALVASLLSVDKSKRPSSASDVRDALRRIAEQPDLTAARALPVPDSVRKYWPHALAAVSLLVAILVVALDDDEPVAAPAEVEAPAEPDEQPTPAPRETAKREPAKPAPPAPAPRVNVGENAVDAELLAQLFDGKRQTERREAARELLDDEDELPRYVALAAAMEKSGRCAERKELLEEMRQLGDPRVLPMLRRMVEQRRSGCGFLGLSDCLACLRKELAETAAALEAVGK